MRRIVDTLIVLMLTAMLAGVAWYYKREQERQRRVAQVQQALAQLQEQVIYQKALGVEGGVFPQVIRREWFGGTLPRNGLVPANQTWIDVALEGDWADHPPDPVIRSPKQAGFWYNPQRGIIRARVPEEFSKRQTVALYNLVNGTNLSELVETNDPQRQPVAVEKLVQVAGGRADQVEPAPAGTSSPGPGAQSLRR